MRILCILLVVIVYPIHFSFAQSFEKANCATEKILARLVEASNVPGLSVAISYKNEIIWSKNYGYSNLEYQVSTSDSSAFRIASLSKLFTGTAIYKLHKAGAINLQDPISKYLDSIPEVWKSITIQQIAQHTSGIGHYVDVEDALDVTHYSSTKDALSKFMNRPLEHLPDEGVTYSSYAYTVLAAIIEKATGKDFEHAMLELVFEPLAMHQTKVDDQQRIIPNRVGFYQYGSDRQPENAPFIDLSGRWAGSGYLSSAIDLAKFGAAHTFTSDYFSEEDLNALTSPRKINDTLTTKEGLGWGQRTSWEDELMYWGDGKTPGSTCGLLVFPEHSLSIAIACNMRNAPLERGDFEILSKRYLAAIKGEKTKELQEKESGSYALELTIGDNKYDGSLHLSSAMDSSGNFDFHNVQKFPIADAFWIQEELWVVAVGGGEGPIALGLLPLKLTKKKKTLEGEIFRISTTFTGSRLP